MGKALLSGILVFISVGIFFFLLFTFALYEFNPGLWSIESRSVYVVYILFFGGILGGATFGCLLDKSKKED